MNTVTAKRRFQTINLIAIVLLFILILAGGVVRSTGSGMGCPDWPKCFGRYIPPTSAADLPADYKQKYIAGRKAKNLRFAKTLDVFGYSELATRLREDRSILIPEEFNAARTWTEYINRLIGAISGLFLLLMAVFSFSYRSTNKLIIVACILNLVLVAFQAWLGSIVVSTNLVAWVVTVHMLLALAILALCIYTFHLAKTYGWKKLKLKPLIYIVSSAALLLSIIQISLGTSVREKIDEVSSRLQGSFRQDWVTGAGQVFANHRDMSILVFIVNMVLYALVRKFFNRHSIHQQLMSLTFLLIMLQMGAGVTLSYFSLPPFAQAAHIALASLIFGAQFYLLLNFYRSANIAGARK